MSKRIIVEFDSTEDLAIALGFAGAEEMYEDYDTPQEAVAAVWGKQDVTATVFVDVGN
jgi:hypothetical protein